MGVSARTALNPKSESLDRDYHVSGLGSSSALLLTDFPRPTLNC